MITNTTETKVEEMGVYKERFVYKEAVFGLIKWEEVQRSDLVGRILTISSTAKDYDAVIINGNEYIKK